MSWYPDKSRRVPEPAYDRTVSKRPFVDFNGERFYKDIDGYFKTSRSRGNRLLHREVYKTFNGELVPGWHIHHIDENRSNNQPENLEQLDPGSHKIEHGHSGIAIASSEEMSEIRRRDWENRKPIPKTCAYCGEPYFAMHNRSRYCCRKHAKLGHKQGKRFF